MRRVLILSTSLAGAMAIAAGIAAFTTGHAADRPAEPLGQPVRVATVSLRPAAQSVRYAAVIKPRIESDISFRVSGKMLTRLVDVGTRVAAGTRLAELDPADLQLQVNALEAQLASAQADAVNADHDFERGAKLLQDGWVTRQTYDSRRAAKDTADAKVREVAANLKVARDDARYATLTADGPGVVTEVLAEPGQVLSQGQAVFKIARLGEMEAVADIPEQAVAGLSKADLSVTLWALPDLSIRGHLREISPSADAATRTYRAKVTLIDPPAEVQLGMTATLVVGGGEAGMAALLPMTALTKSGEHTAVLVLNQAQDGLELRPIQVAAYIGDQMAVTGGLRDGEAVVTAGVQKLDPGQKVRVWTEPNR
jgi:RND family efflux transporter MFP subunit